jgi:CheY-like chemotaxis protein
VSLEQRDQKAVLRERDNCIGIPAGQQDREFYPFSQAEQKLDRAAGGLGLGLTLVKQLVALHGGAVQVRSEGEGQGAEFIVTLPVDTIGTSTAQPQPAASSHPRRRVLVVEDNVDSADTLSILLKTRGHEVDVCYSGDQALAKAKGFHPDTVLCDIGLPGMDGYEVARALRDDSALRQARLVALTGYASSEDREKALAAGFDKHLVKPPSVEELEQVLSD